MDNIKDPEQKEAIESIKRIAEMKLAKERKYLEQKAKEKALLTAKDLGISEDQLMYGAAAAKIADAINNKKLEGSFDINDNLRLQGSISTTERSLKLFYNKRFY